MGTLYAIHRSSFLIRNASQPRARICRTKTRTRSDRIRRRFPFIVHCKRSAFQDFQGYAKPSCLLPATEPEVCTDLSLEDKLTPFQAGGSECFYIVNLRTSSMNGSGLSNLNAGILVCLVDRMGNSILQRLPAILAKNHLNQSEGHANSDYVHFQRGSVDQFTFKGTKLGKIEALWVGLESGQWRLAGASLVITCQNQSASDESEGKDLQCIGTEYTFETDDTLLGEGSDTSMAELRSCLIREFVGNDVTSLSENLLRPPSVADNRITKEESMREYADLKFSLLLYDGLLVLSGSSVAFFSVGRNSGFAFLAGGAVGFLYLFLLQRSVDGLPSLGSASVQKRGEVGEAFRNSKGPLVSLAVAFTFAAIAVKYGSDGMDKVLAPKEVMCGMFGFLVCKVAVVLAAFKTVPLSMEENN